MESADASPEPHHCQCAKCAKLRADVLQMLCRSGYPPLRRVDCEVHGNRIVLQGVVPTFHMKQLVQTLVLKMGNVQSVENLIEVQ